MDLYSAAINRVAKWRTIFTGWQLGTRVKGDPEADAVRDHREATIMLRLEVSALAALLVKKGLFTADDFTRAVAEEAEHLNLAYEKRFPGIKATDEGMVLTFPEANETMKNWRK